MDNYIIKLEVFSHKSGAFKSIIATNKGTQKDYFLTIYNLDHYKNKAEKICKKIISICKTIRFYRCCQIFFDHEIYTFDSIRPKNIGTFLHKFTVVEPFPMISLSDYFDLGQINIDHVVNGFFNIYKTIETLHSLNIGYGCLSPLSIVITNGIFSLRPPNLSKYYCSGTPPPLIGRNKYRFKTEMVRYPHDQKLTNSKRTDCLCFGYLICDYVLYFGRNISFLFMKKYRQLDIFLKKFALSPFIIPFLRPDHDTFRDDSIKVKLKQFLLNRRNLLSLYTCHKYVDPSTFNEKNEMFAVNSKPAKKAKPKSPKKAPNAKNAQDCQVDDDYSEDDINNNYEIITDSQTQFHKHKNPSKKSDSELPKKSNSEEKHKYRPQSTTTNESESNFNFDNEDFQALSQAASDNSRFSAYSDASDYCYSYYSLMEKKNTFKKVETIESYDYDKKSSSNENDKNDKASLSAQNPKQSKNINNKNQGEPANPVENDKSNKTCQYFDNIKSGYDEYNYDSYNYNDYDEPEDNIHDDHNLLASDSYNKCTNKNCNIIKSTNNCQNDAIAQTSVRIKSCTSTKKCSSKSKDSEYEFNLPSFVNLKYCHSYVAKFKLEYFKPKYSNKNFYIHIYAGSSTKCPEKAIINISKKIGDIKHHHVNRTFHLNDAALKKCQNEGIAVCVMFNNVVHKDLIHLNLRNISFIPFYDNNMYRMFSVQTTFEANE